jgi:hypothetical protein
MNRGCDPEKRWGFNRVKIANFGLGKSRAQGRGQGAEGIGHSVTEEGETEESGRLGIGKWGRCRRWKLSIAGLGFWPDEAESRGYS